MNTIIEKIRAEIERLKGICTAQIEANPGQTFPFVMEMTGYDKLLSVLSDLEKEEKPSEGLEEEMIAWHKKHFKGKRKWEETSGEYLEHSSQLDLARHFAQWGAEHRGSSETPNDLEEAAEEYAKLDEEGKWKDGGKYKGFIAGAKWQKAQSDKELSEKIAAAYQLGLADKEKMMMKEAVEGIAVINANAKDDGFGYVRSDYVTDDFLRGLGRFKIIIVKED